MKVTTGRQKDAKMYQFTGYQRPVLVIRVQPFLHPGSDHILGALTTPPNRQKSHQQSVNGSSGAQEEDRCPVWVVPLQVEAVAPE